MSKSNWSLKRTFRSVLPTPARVSDDLAQHEQSTAELLAQSLDELAPSEHNEDIRIGDVTKSRSTTKT